MAPVRRDVRERPQHEAALLQPRMRQDQLPAASPSGARPRARSSRARSRRPAAPRRRSRADRGRRPAAPSAARAAARAPASTACSAASTASGGSDADRAPRRRSHSPAPTPAGTPASGTSALRAATSSPRAGERAPAPPPASARGAPAGEGRFAPRAIRCSEDRPTGARGIKSPFAARPGRHISASDRWKFDCSGPICKIVREEVSSMFYRDERLALFIDGANLYAAARALGFDIDYKLLRTEFMRRGKLLARLLLHRAARDRGIFADPPAGRLAELQRLRDGDQARQGVHRLHRPAQGQGQHGHRACGGRDGDGAACRPYRALLRRRRLPAAGRDRCSARASASRWSRRSAPRRR